MTGFETKNDELEIWVRAILIVLPYKMTAEFRRQDSQTLDILVES
jgi:hypothetical protein